MAPAGGFPVPCHPKPRLSVEPITHAFLPEHASIAKGSSATGAAYMFRRSFYEPANDITIMLLRLPVAVNWVLKEKVQEGSFFG